MSSAIQSNPAILGGTPRFSGTRVPIKSLFDSLEAGDTLGEFLRQFPTVTHSQAIAVLAQARAAAEVQAGVGGNERQESR